MSLNARHLRFCEEYVIDLNFFRAASAAGLSAHPIPLLYYVYFLVNPINGRVFYIGKGKGKRMHQHLVEFKKLSGRNAKKLSAIESIVADGGKPSAVIIANNLSEHEAYRLESHFIKKLMATGITNIQTGNTPYIDRSKTVASMHLSKMLSFEEFCRLRKPDNASKRLFLAIKQEFQRMQLIGSITKIIHVKSGFYQTIRYE